MTCPTDTVAQAPRVAYAATLLRMAALAGILVAALVLAFGPRGAAANPLNAGHVLPAQVGAHATTPSALILAPIIAEADDPAGEAVPARTSLRDEPRPAATGYGPRGAAVPPGRGMMPPHRPPRHA